MRNHISSARIAIAVVVACAALGTASRSDAIVVPPDAPPGSASTYQLNALHDGHSSDQLSLPLGKLWSLITLRVGTALPPEAVSAERVESEIRLLLAATG